MAKRLVDVILSAGLLLFFSPLLVCAAMLIRLTSPGPALFRQTRTGRNFQPFQILKLRTMAPGRPQLAYTVGGDPRITPIGRFLREAKIDELPQLWNVLRGDMSLVGPRPVVPQITRQFRRDYEKLLCVRPGLTDPASIKYRWEARLLASMPDSDHYFRTVVTPDKLRISAGYLDRANLWTDALTLAATVLVCCFPPLYRIHGTRRGSREVERAIPTDDLLHGNGIGDGAVFCHRQAQIEAMEEHRHHASVLPLIPLANPELVAQSTSQAQN